MTTYHMYVKFSRFRSDSCQIFEILTNFRFLLLEHILRLKIALRDLETKLQGLSEINGHPILYYRNDRMLVLYQRI